VSIRRAVIVSVSGHMLNVRYEGLPDSCDAQFTELSPDIHPVGYCKHTNHPLTTDTNITQTKPKPERVIVINEEGLA
jgi:hypothetical protein